MDGDKLLSDMEFGGVKTKNMRKAQGQADVPAEEPLEDDRDDENDIDTETDSDTDSDSSDSDSEYECRVCNKKFSAYKNLKQHEKGRKHARALKRKRTEKKLLEKGSGTVMTDDDAENIIQEPYAICNTCDKQFSGPESYKMHLKSKPHKQKLLLASFLEQVRENGEINTEKLTELCKRRRSVDSAHVSNTGEFSAMKLDDVDEEFHEEFECKECDKVFTGLTPFTEHLLSKTHAKQVEKKKLLHKVIPERPRDESISDESKKTDISSLCLEDDVLVCKACLTSFSGPENAMMHLKSKKHFKSLDKYLRKLERKKEKRASKNSGEKEEEDRPPKEHENEGTEENPQSTIKPLDVSDIPNHPDEEEEADKPAVSEDNESKYLSASENYKRYKDIMKSLREDDKILD